MNLRLPLLPPRGMPSGGNAWAKESPLEITPTHRALYGGRAIAEAAGVAR